MLDLGRTIMASAERSPQALALVDGALRLSYRDWLDRIVRLVGALDRLGLQRGDHLVTVLQNRWEAATLHWACQLAGIIVTPVNWRAKADELEYCLVDADARALVFQDVSAAAVAGASAAGALPRIALDDAPGGNHRFDDLLGDVPPSDLPADLPRARADDISLMLYTSGTTGRPKGVPRRHRAERAAALAHVAQNLYRRGERTLGVMPLYHTMGVRSLLAMALIDGCFVCQRRFDPVEALAEIARERVTTLYLVPTLYHDLVHHVAFSRAAVASVRKLGFAGAPMTDALLQKLVAEFAPELFVNHYGSSEVYSFAINQDAAAKPGCAGKAGINELIRVVTLGAADPDDPAARAVIGEEGQIICHLDSDEAFEGYWRRPDADAKAIRGRWYFTGDTGYLDEDGDLFVTGRVDDMIITGGENVSPVEIESRLSLHPAVAEVAVVGLPDARWGQRVAAFIKRAEAFDEASDAAALDLYCRESGMANFKRPRDYVFVDEIPKSPVGKILRRKLVAGEYQPETTRKRAS
jgi:2-furoate---CoA ligase